MGLGIYDKNGDELTKGIRNNKFELVDKDGKVVIIDFENDTEAANWYKQKWLAQSATINMLKDKIEYLKSQIK
jgi:malate synthase